MYFTITGMKKSVRYSDVSMRTSLYRGSAISRFHCKNAVNYWRIGTDCILCHSQIRWKSLTVNSEQFYVMYQAWDAVFHYQMKYWEESWKYDEQRSILPLTCDVRFQSVTRPSLLNWYTHKRDIFSPKPTWLVQTLFATVHYLPDEILQSFIAFQYKPSPFCNSWIATVYPSTDYGLIAVTRTFFKSDKRWNSYLTSIRSWPSKVECYCAESY